MALAEFALPEFRFRTEAGVLALRDGLVLTFFLTGEHGGNAAAVHKAIERYLRLPGMTERFGTYDAEGTPVLLEHGELLALLERRLAPDRTESRLALIDSLEGASGFSVAYEGLAPSRRRDAGWPHAAGGLRFAFPTDYGGDQGLLTMLAFATELAATLPYSCGYCSPAFVPHEGVGEAAAYGVIRGLSRRLRCLDIPALLVDCLEIGDGPKGAYWGNFLSAPLVAALGNEQSIRQKLAGHTMRIRDAGDGSLSIWVAPTPIAGDTNRRESLAQYRALFGVLAPCIRERTVPYLGLDDESMAEWIHRFAEGPDPSAP